MKKLVITTALTAAACIGGSLAMTSSVPAASASVSHNPPHWFHWQYASKAATREVCGSHQPRAIIVIQGHSGNSVIICASGNSEGS